jgi:thiol:disulfide interchange protein DsbA
MKRSLFTLLTWVLLGATAAAEEAPVFEEGVHYQRLPVSVETHDASKVEVVEVFSYACIHCKTFDPTLEAWRGAQTDEVDFHRIPAIFNPTWALFGQAFYAADVLGVGEAVHLPIFKAVHEQGVDLRDPNLMAQLFQDYGGVSPDEFTQVFDSFSVRSRVQQADAHGRAYRVSGVPALVVDGTFRVDGRMAGSNARMLQVVDYLVAQQQAAKGLQSAETGASAPSAPVELGVQ